MMSRRWKIARQEQELLVRTFGKDHDRIRKGVEYIKNRFSIDVTRGYVSNLFYRWGKDIASNVLEEDSFNFASDGYIPHYRSTKQVHLSRNLLFNF